MNKALKSCASNLYCHMDLAVYRLAAVAGDA